MPRTLALPIWGICASLAFGQSQVLVKLNVAATDAKGAPVTDLRADDIQIREDGKLRPVVFFHFAGGKAQLAQAGPEEFHNHQAPPATLILLDRWNEKEMTLASAWQDVATAVKRLENVDRTYLYFLANHGDLVPVNPLPTIETDLRPLEPPTAASLVAKLNQTVRTLTGLRDVANLEPFVRADTTLQALGIVSRMAAIPGQKNLVWVTHGFPIQIFDLAGQLKDYSGPVRGLAENAIRAQVAFYTVDQSEKGAGADPTGLSRQTLELLSGQTGGRWYSSGSAYEALAGAAKDARASYQLAYYSTASGPKEHKLRIDTARKGVHLLTRAGYTGDDAMPDPDQMADEIFTRQGHSPFEATEIGVSVVVSRKPGAVHMEIHLDPQDIFLEHVGAKYEGSLCLRFALYEDGVFQGAQPIVPYDLALDQEQYDKAMKNGIAMAGDIIVANTTQQVRVMVYDRKIHGLGSVTLPVK